MPVAVITGASSGLGVEFLRAFGRDKYDLVLVARSEGKLRELAERFQRECGVKTYVIPADLAEPGSADKVFAEVERLGITVDALVNNAGYGDYGPFADTDLAKELGMMQLNMVSLVHLTKLALRQMKAKGEGEVLNVASTAAFQPGPLMAVYYATKAFVLSFSEALADELEGTGIRVSVLCPGPTETGFVKAAAMEGSKLFKQGGVMGAEEVVDVGYRGLKRGRRVVIPGLRNRLLAQSVRFAPRRMVTAMVRRFQSPA